MKGKFFYLAIATLAFSCVLFGSCLAKKDMDTACMFGIFSGLSVFFVIAFKED